MKINRRKFYVGYRKEYGKLSQAQVNSIECIFNEVELQKIEDLRQVAYMFATVYHETARTMLPIEEYGKGRTRIYGKRYKHSGAPYSTKYGIMYGRGYVQLTWYENYELMGRLLCLDLLNHPELALVPQHAAKIMVEGMTKGSSNVGDFTGKCLELYFTDTVENPKGARRIINGTDKDDEIAAIYYIFKSFLI
jgi:predicted chitinase